MATKDHWIVTAYQHANDKEFSLGYFDGTRTQAFKHFNAKKNVSRYFRPGYTVTMQPNAIILWDGYETNPALRKKGNTSVSDTDGWKVVRFHQTDIVSISTGNVVVLNSGTWKTATTKQRMNQAADEFDLGYKVYAKKRVWYIDTPYDGTIEFFDGVRFQGNRTSNPKRKRKVAKKKRSAKQLANDKRLGRMAKARAKTKRKGKRKKVARKKTTRRVVRRKTKRNPSRARGAIVSKRSHLWNIFKCRGNSVHFLALSSTGKIRWTLTRGDTVTWKMKSIAAKVAKKLATNRTYSKFQLGLANQNQTVPQIAAACKKGK